MCDFMQNSTIMLFYDCAVIVTGELCRGSSGGGGRNVGGPVFNQRGTLKNDKNDI